MAAGRLSLEPLNSASCPHRTSPPSCTSPASPGPGPCACLYTREYTLRVVSPHVPRLYAVPVNKALSGYPFPFDGPAAYRIVVHGLVARDLADRLEGLQIEQTVGHDGTDVSVLSGSLADQTALTSVLVSLHELQMVLLSVEQVPPDSPADSELASTDLLASSTPGKSPPEAA